MNGYDPTIAAEVIREIETVETMGTYYDKFASFMDLFYEEICAVDSDLEEDIVDARLEDQKNLDDSLLGALPRQSRRSA